MMPKRQAEFRADYRPRISPWYSGVLHVIVIYAIGIAALAYFIPHIHDPTWLEWLVVPGVFLACNVFEWWIHRYRDASPGQGLHGHLSPPYAGASPVLHRRRTDDRHDPRLPHHVLPALCAGHVHRDLGPAGVGAGLSVVGQRRVAVDVHDRRHVPELRVLPLGLPRQGRPARSGMCRSSTRSGAITSPITTRRS